MQEEKNLLLVKISKIAIVLGVIGMIARNIVFLEDLEFIRAIETWLFLAGIAGFIYLNWDVVDHLLDSMSRLPPGD